MCVHTQSPRSKSSRDNAKEKQALEDLYKFFARCISVVRILNVQHVTKHLASMSFAVQIMN